MNIKMKATVLVLAKNERLGSNGRDKYCNIAVLSEKEAGNVSCTYDVYEKVEIGAENEILFAYNEQYKSLRAVDVIPPSVVELPEAANVPEVSPESSVNNLPETTVPEPEAKQTEKQEAKQNGRSDAKQEKAVAK